MCICILFPLKQRAARHPHRDQGSAPRGHNPSNLHLPYTLYTYIYKYIFIYANNCFYIYVYIYMYIYIYVYIYIYIYM